MIPFNQSLHQVYASLSRNKNITVYFTKFENYVWLNIIVTSYEGLNEYCVFGCVYDGQLFLNKQKHIDILKRFC
jgi:hypothetical protein